jgi:hypothetical protein
MFVLQGNGTGNTANFPTDEEVIVAPGVNAFREL